MTHVTRAFAPVTNSEYVGQWDCDSNLFRYLNNRYNGVIEI